MFSDRRLCDEAVVGYDKRLLPAQVGNVFHHVRSIAGGTKKVQYDRIPDKGVEGDRGTIHCR